MAVASALRCRTHSGRTVFRLLGQSHRLSSSKSDNPPEVVEDELAALSLQEEDEIEKMRHVSRLPESLFRAKTAYLKLPKDKMQLDPERVANLHRNQQRRLYARLGKASGVNPSIMWPSLEELREKKRLENEWDPTLDEMMANIERRKTDEAEFMKKRIAMVESNMAKMDTWVKEYRQRRTKQVEEKERQEQKKQKMIEEAREFFGYYVDPRDSKFKTMMEEKEKEEKKMAKQKKREQREAKMVARLQAEADQAS